MRVRRLIPIAVVLVVAAVVVPMASAAEETTTTTSSTFAPGEEPAVIAVPSSTPEPEPPWTARFLIPTLIATAIILIGGTALYYFARIKSRYRVVGD